MFILSSLVVTRICTSTNTMMINPNIRWSHFNTASITGLTLAVFYSIQAIMPLAHCNAVKIRIVMPHHVWNGPIDAVTPDSAIMRNPLIHVIILTMLMQKKCSHIAHLYCRNASAQTPMIHTMIIMRPCTSPLSMPSRLGGGPLKFVLFGAR